MVDLEKSKDDTQTTVSTSKRRRPIKDGKMVFPSVDVESTFSALGDINGPSLDKTNK